MPGNSRERLLFCFAHRWQDALEEQVNWTCQFVALQVVLEVKEGNCKQHQPWEPREAAESGQCDQGHGNGDEDAAHVSASIG